MKDDVSLWLVPSGDSVWVDGEALTIDEIVAAIRERDELRTITRLARERLYDAHGRGSETVTEVIRAVGNILRRASAISTTTTTSEGQR